MGTCVSKAKESTFRRWVSVARRRNLLSKGNGMIYVHLGFTMGPGNKALLLRLYEAFCYIEAESTFYAQQALEPVHQKRRPGLVRCGDVLAHLVDTERSGFADTIVTAWSKTNRMRKGKARIQRNENGTGMQLDFHAFVLSLWSFLTVPIVERPMARFLFDLYDVDESGTLDASEIKLMLADMRGPDWRNNANCVKLLSLLRDKAEVMLCEEEFVEFCCRSPTFLVPVSNLQQRMKQRIGHGREWDALSIHRNAISLDQPFLSLRVILEVFHRNDAISTDEVVVRMNDSASAHWSLTRG
jgi:hypothetical protein